MGPAMFVARVRCTSLVSGIRRGCEGNATGTTRFVGILEREWGRSKRKYCTNSSWSLSQLRTETSVNSSWNINLKGGNVNDWVRKGCRALSMDAFHWTGGANNRVRAGEVVLFNIGSELCNICVYNDAYNGNGNTYVAVASACAVDPAGGLDNS